MLCMRRRVRNRDGDRCLVKQAKLKLPKLHRDRDSSLHSSRIRLSLAPPISRRNEPHLALPSDRIDSRLGDDDLFSTIVDVGCFWNEKEGVKLAAFARAGAEARKLG